MAEMRLAQVAELRPVQVAEIRLVLVTEMGLVQVAGMRVACMEKKLWPKPFFLISRRGESLLYRRCTQRLAHFQGP